jgi:hypothetical protein
VDAGYSGTSLTRKLGLKPGQSAYFSAPPDGYLDTLELDGVEVLENPRAGLDFAQLFVTKRADLQAQLKALLPLLARDGTIWVSWPKRTAVKQLKLPADMSEDAVRAVALPLGLVDNKVCAVDDTWSGLKLVIRRELR